MNLTRSNIGKQIHNQSPLLVFDTTQMTSEKNYSNPQPGDPCHPLAAGAHVPAVAFHTSGYGAQVDEIAPTLQASDARLSNQVAGVIEPTMVVRRLTPLECERLMGQPDNATLITYRGKPAADGPRYKALGNSKVVDVVLWIGRQIERVRGNIAH